MEKQVRVEVEFPQGPLPGRVACELLRPCRVALNVLRGRVTERTAWFLLEISGTARGIREALRSFQERGLTVRTYA